MRLLSRDDRVSRGAIANLGRFNSEYIYKIVERKKEVFNLFLWFLFFSKNSLSSLRNETNRKG